MRFSGSVAAIAILGVILASELPSVLAASPCEGYEKYAILNRDAGAVKVLKVRGRPRGGGVSICDGKLGIHHHHHTCIYSTKAIIADSTLLSNFQNHTADSNVS